MAVKPSINVTLSSLAAEVVTPEPFVVALSGSKRITFPDLFNKPAEEAADFFRDLEELGQNEFGYLEKWLSPEDFATYKAEKVPLRVHAALMQKVVGYYESTMGTPGEGSASKR